MQENEIMLGDWVRLRYTTTGGKEVVKDFRVGQIRKLVETYYIYDDNGQNMGYVEKLEPIPINPEILEKYGFESYNEGLLFNLKDDICDEYGSDFNLEKEYKGNSFFFVCAGTYVCKISFVHELQHALRICGIGKEIEL